MKKAIDLCSSYWTDYYKSTTPSAIVDGVELLINCSSFPGDKEHKGRVYPITILTSSIVETIKNERQAYAVSVNCPFSPVAIITSTYSNAEVYLNNADFVYENGTLYLFNNIMNKDEIKSKLIKLSSGYKVVLWAVELSDWKLRVEPLSGSFLAFAEALEYVYDSPSVKHDSTVVEVTNVERGNVVVTEHEVLTLPAGVTASVGVGDAVTTGDSVGEGWRLIRLGPGDITEPYIALPADKLVGGLTGDLVWHNTPTNTVVDTVSGKTRIRWAVGGTSGNVTDFWTAVHARAISGHVSLAEGMDKRVTPFGQPSASDLPLVVNPANIICRSMAGNVFIIDVDSSKFGPNAITDRQQRLNIIKRSMTPSTGVIEYEGMPSTAAILP